MNRFFSATLILLSIFLANAAAKADESKIIVKAFETQMPDRYTNLNVMLVGVMNSSMVPMISGTTGENQNVMFFKVTFQQGEASHSCIATARKSESQAGLGQSIYSVEVFFCDQAGEDSLAKPSLIKLDVAA